MIVLLVVAVSVGVVAAIVTGALLIEQGRWAREPFLFPEAYECPHCGVLFVAHNWGERQAWLETVCDDAPYEED